MIYLLDTNAISRLMREDQRMTSWLSSVPDRDRIVASTIVRGEIQFGIGRIAQGRRRSQLDAKARKLFTAIPCESIPPEAGDLYAETKLTQQRLGLSLDENDLWIAAATLCLGATLVSQDNDFLKIEALVVLVF